MASTDIHLEFPDDGTRDDFEIAFRGWPKQYQQRASVAKGLLGAGSIVQPQGTTGGLQGAGGTGEHTYGAGGQQAGLFSLPPPPWWLPSPTVQAPLYLNFTSDW